MNVNDGSVAVAVESNDVVETAIPVAVEGGEVGAVAEVTTTEGGEVTATEAKTPRPRTTDEEFLTAWEGSKSVEEVAEKLELAVQSVEQRATKLRKRGWPIKKFERKQTAVVDGFAIIARLRGITVEQLQAEVAAKNAPKSETVPAADAS